MEELNEEESNIISLTDENGEEVRFEFLDLVKYRDDEYMLLLPEEEDETQVVILRIEPIDAETESYVSVSDEEILNAVYDVFKEKYKDILTFED